MHGKIKYHHKLCNAVNPDVLESQVNTLKLTELEPMLPVIPFTKVVHQIKFLKIFHFFC